MNAIAANNLRIRARVYPFTAASKFKGHFEDQPVGPPRLVRDGSAKPVERSKALDMAAMSLVDEIFYEHRGMRPYTPEELIEAKEMVKIARQELCRVHGA